MLEGYNYGYWNAWNVVEKGWTTPTVIIEKGIVTDLTRDRWTDDQHKEAMGNSKAMNAIFSAVDENIFKLISNCDFAKETWDILLVAHKGTDKVKSQRLRMLTTKFENINVTTRERPLAESRDVGQCHISYNQHIKQIQNK